MNDHISARYQNRRGKRLLCLLLCLLFLFSMDSGVAGVLVEPVQAAAAAIGAGVSRGVSGLGSLMGGSFSKLGGLLLSIGGGDGDGGDEEEPEEPEPDPHDLNEVYWNPSPEDKLGPDGTVILLKGDDENSGVDDTHAVLTWERALSLVKPGGVIWVLTMETVLYSEEQPVTVRDGAVLNDNGEPQVTELKFYPGCSILLSSGIETDVEDAVGASLTLKNLKMTDKTEDEDPEDKNRLLLLNGGTVTLDVGTTMRGDVRIEQFSDETEGSESPEIYVTPEFADAFDANVDLTVNFDTRLSDHHANSGDKIAFDFLVFPEGFDVEDILDNVHLDPLLREPRGEDNLVWSVRKKIGADNIVEIYLVEPYDGCVYVSGLGNDEWEGLYASRPVRTFARALEILQGNGGDLSYTGYFSDNVTTINEYRWLHGEFVPNEGLIRICGAPVEITETETWSMPHDTYWDRGPTGKKLDDNGNPYPRVDQSWVERYKHYVDDLIEVRTGGNLTLTDITVKGVKSIAKNATGSLLVVDAYGNATLGADALLTDNTAVEGGGARLVGNQAELIISGGRITNCLVSRNGNTGMGGGVYVHGGNLTMISGEITDNNANLGGGVYVDNYEGTAGSALLSSTGRIYLYGGSQITRNQAQQGGGVYTSGSDTVLLPNDASTATIAAYDNGFDAFSSICCISVTGNTASSFGGGWMAEDCTLTIDGAEVTGNNVILRNNSGAGGGVALRRGYLKMINGASVHDNYVQIASISSILTAQGGGVYSTSAPKALGGESITKYSIEIGEGCSLYNNCIEASNSSSTGRSLNGGALCIGGSSGAAVYIDGEIRDNSIKNTYYSSSSDRRMCGAGLYFSGVDAYLEQHCRVTGNYLSDQVGGMGIGIYSNGGSLHLDNCEIDNNIRVLPHNLYTQYSYTTYGGGVYKTGGSIDFNGCRIHDNIVRDAPYTGSELKGGGAFLENLASVNIEPGLKIFNHTGYAQGGGIYINNTNTSSPVTVFTSGETDDVNNYAEIFNNTVKDGDYYGGGGGIYVYASQKIDLKCLKVYNNNGGYGGGMYITRSNVVNFDRCIFTNNRAVGTTNTSMYTSGGAVLFNQMDATSRNYDVHFDSCEFYKNYARDRGGAVCLYGSNGYYQYQPTSSYYHYNRYWFDNECIFGDGTAENANIAGNASVNGYGGALYIYAGEVTVTGGTRFDRNTATYRGGAIFDSQSGSYPQYLNVTAADKDIVFRHNSAGNYGGAVYADYGTLRVSGGGHRVIFEENSAGARGGAIQYYQATTYLDHCDFIRNAMEWVPPVVGVDEEGHWEPTACKGRSLSGIEAYVYLDASTVTADQFYFYNRNYCIKLNGVPNDAFGTLQVDLNIASDSYFRDGDHVVEYTTNVADCTPYLENFILVNEPDLVYNLTPVSKNLVLAPKIVYIDGVDGDDANTGDLPTRAVKTFPMAREKLVELLEVNPSAPLKICIVNTVTIDADSTADESMWTFDGYQKPHLDEDGQRDGTYEPITGVLMQAYIADNRLNRVSKALIDVNGGDLTIDHITLDGNRSAKPSLGSNYGIKVYNSGKLSLVNGTVIQNHRDAIYAYGSSQNPVTVEITDSKITNCNQGTSTSNTFASGSDSTRDNASAGVTVKSGVLTMDNVEVSGCYGWKRGGGIYLASSVGTISNLHLFNCNVDQSISSSNSYDDVYSSYSYNYYPNRQNGYRGRGGGAYFESCNVTMTDSVFEKNGNQTKEVTGVALAVRGGTLTATNVLFSENGKQDIKNSSGYLDSNGYAYGTLHVGSSANVTLNLCTFTKCYGYYGGAIRLDIGNITTETVYANNTYIGTLYKGNYAPTLHLNGCTFSGDWDNCNYSYNGGSVIWSQGFDYWLDKDSHHYHDSCYPEIHIDEYVHEENGEEVHTPTLIKTNISRQYFGAIYSHYSDVYVADSKINDNWVYYPYSLYNSRWSGGAAFYLHGGSLTMDRCEVKSNTSQQRSTYVTCGAVAVLGQADGRRDAALTVRNSTIDSNRITCDTSGAKTIRGAGITGLYTKSVLIEDSTVNGNSLSIGSGHNYGTNAVNAYGGGLNLENCTSIRFRNVEANNNKIDAKSSQRTVTRGAAMHIYNSSTVFDNVTAVGNTSEKKIAISISTAVFTGFKTSVTVDKDILLNGNTTPITLLSPLNNCGELPLRFDETFMGRHIVCGYTDDETDPEYAGAHVYSSLPAVIAAELPAAGELDAWDYLAEGGETRFTAGEEPAARNLLLVPGNAYEKYTHDIIVSNLCDVYLDGQTGVDPDVDENGDIISFNADSTGLVHDGRAPKQAVKTFAAAKKVLESGLPDGNIIICGQVDITGEETWTLGNVTNAAGATWHAGIVRHNNPKESSSARYTEYLIDVKPGGALYLDNVEINGTYTQCDTPRVFKSLIRVSGGELVLRGGTRLTDNNADTGGAVSVTAADSLVEMYDAAIDLCTVDQNTVCGAQYAYGGALYIVAGEFRMMSAASLIESCGTRFTHNNSSRGDYCYGAAVYVNGGVFRMFNGKITDTQLYRSPDYYQYSSGYMTIYGVVFVEGARYNDETGEGSLAQIGGEISFNFLKLSGNSFIYDQSHTSNSYPLPIYGSAVAMFNGTTRLTGAVTASIDPDTGATQPLSSGAKITGNRLHGNVSYGMVYLKGNTGVDANSTAQLIMDGGRIDGQNNLDSTYGSYSYLIYICEGGSMIINDGYVGMDYCLYGIYLTHWKSYFSMRGGNVHNTSGSATSAIYCYDNTVRMSGGLISGNPNRNISGGIYSEGGCQITGGEISSFKNCVQVNDPQGWNLSISGGKLHNASNACVYANGRYNHYISGGEFYDAKYGIECTNTGTKNISRADIHGCNTAGIYLHSGCNLNITSDDVDIHNNTCSQAPIYVTDGNLNMTGGLIRDNTCTDHGGGIRTTSGIKSFTVSGVTIRDNKAKNNGGAIYINTNGTKTYTLKDSEIFNNEAQNDSGGGIFYYDTSSGSYTSTLNCSGLKIYNNKCKQNGGGVWLAGRTAGQLTLDATFTNCDVHDNTASGVGGGVYLSAGSDTTTASPARLTMNVNFHGTKIDKNAASGNGGGLYINRAKRNNVRLTVRFRNSDDSQRCTINQNRAVNGGGIAIVSTINNATFPVRAPSDISVYLNDTKVSKNIASLSGGGVWIDPCGMLYINNASLTDNEAQTGRGGGIALANEAVCRFSQGEVKKNKATATGIGNGIYVNKADLQFANNYAKIDKENEIYLNDPNYPITMWRSFTRHSNIYYVYPSTDFLAGSIVVKPGGYCDDASPFLQNFYSVRPGTVIDRLTPNLILSRIVFLDGETGIDPVFNSDGSYTFVKDADDVLHDGSTPDAALKTFHASKTVLGGISGSIYVSGPVHYREDDPSEDDVWSLGEKQFLRRYCGFAISDVSYEPFKGDMFTVEEGDLTLENIGIEGAYRAADSFRANGSVFVIGKETASGTQPAPAQNTDPPRLVINEGASVLDNVSSADGAGVRIVKGTLEMNDGEIGGNTTTGNGNAVYQGDTFIVRGNTLKIGGDVFLAKGNPDRYITVMPKDGTEETEPVTALNFKPAVTGEIEVSVENPYHGRDIALYPEDEIPGDDQKNVFPLTIELASMYILDNEPVRDYMLELRLPYSIYIDGVDGNDARNGQTPETAVRTPQRAYELINTAHFEITDEVINGGLVHVVNTVSVDSEMSLSNHYRSGTPGEAGYVDIDAFGTVVFKRYSQPTAHAELTGFEKPTNYGALFEVKSGGELTLSGTVLDGHSFEVPPDSENPKLIAAAVEAQSALVNVKDGGSLFMTAGTMQNAVSTESLGGAITVNTGGMAHLSGGTVRNSLDAQSNSIYDNGDLRLSDAPDISGWIYLESPVGEPEVRITVPTAFDPPHAVKVVPSDPFHGRDICRYTEPQPVPDAAEKNKWVIPEDLSMIYVVNNNEEDQQILELQLRACVYVNGVSGNDAKDGKTPRNAVRTIKQAYKLLSTLPGSTIFIVDNVTLTDSFILDNSYYDDGEDVIDAGGPVQIIRYSQPSAYNDEDPGELVGYDVPGYTSGPLITVPANVSLVISGADDTVTLDGHSAAVTDGDPRFVSPALVSAGALIRVKEGGALTLSSGAQLLNNDNGLPTGGNGGAVENGGSLILDGAEIRNNKAARGAGIYQNGMFELDGTVSPVMDLDQTIWLTGLKDTEDEHIIEVTGELDDHFQCTVGFEWPEGGRNAVHFAEYTFYEEVRNETDHFVLDPELQYILVQSPEDTEPDTLELCEIFTLKYHGNGGTLPDGTTEWLFDPDMPYNSELCVFTYFKGDKIPVRQNDFGAMGAFNRDGKTFVAWNTKPDGSGKTFMPGDTYWSDTVGIFQSVTLYAVWSDAGILQTPLSVTYKANNGTEEPDFADCPPYHLLDTVTVMFNDPAVGGIGYTEPEGKHFFGWNTAPDESGDWYFPPGGNMPGVIPTVTNDDGEFTIAGNIVLYAIYRSLAPYSLTIFKYADVGDLQEPNKTFVFEIEDIWSLSDHYGEKYYVTLGTYTDAVTGETVPAWIDNSYCFATVTGLPESKYLVREVSGWSWRYSLTDAYGADTENYVVSADYRVVVALSDHRTVSFKNALTNPYYVNGYARSYSNTFVRP